MLTLEAVPFDEKEEVSLMMVMELDGRKRDTWWILEANNGSITSYVPFGTYNVDENK